MWSDLVIILGSVSLTLVFSKLWERMAVKVKAEMQRAAFEDVDYLLRR